MKKKVFPWTHFYILERLPFLLLCIIFVSINIGFFSVLYEQILIVFT